MSGVTVWAQGFQPQLKLDAKKPQCKPGNKACGGACIPESHECLADKLKTSLAQKAIGLAALGVAGYIGTRPNAGKFQKGAALAVGALGVGLGAKGVQNFLQVREKALARIEEQKAALVHIQNLETVLNQYAEEGKQLQVVKPRKTAVEAIIEEEGILHDFETTKALVDYTSVHHYTVNGCLRKDIPARKCEKEDIENKVKNIDRGLSLLPKNVARKEHWRGVAVAIDSEFAKAIEQLKVGFILRDPGYSSYSANKDIAISFAAPEDAEQATDVLVRFKSNSQHLTDVTRYSAFGNLEEERVLPRGLKQRVVDIKKTKLGGHSVYTISLEDA